MTIIDKFKRDIGQRPGRAAVLGVLTVALLAMSVRAFIEVHPRGAAGSVATGEGAAEAPKGTANGSSAIEAEVKIKENRELWNTLREKKPQAVGAASAFTFDASYFTLDPSTRVTLVTPEKPEVIKPAAVPVTPMIDPEAMKQARIREQAKGLVVKSTSMGNGMSEPMAIVNQQLLTVGQTILGFEITAIRAREVEFKKEGQTTVVKMVDGQ
ncbi:MAG TPA: hypothetical protein VGN88_04135 [Phycisphaerae bacterium]|jgi:hypothetical protein